MRIQHNIPAMNAYRNYNSNVKSLQANLQKLSSGYRINKAGDDAAGLAISEKMRAQITGLEVAQKNAKDGISLVQTAEGAMTEVHDMLNRMYELAEQSANGTYADEVDREQMQKEIESLRTEINRIADSTNFNGLNLLDGSLESGLSKTVPGETISVPIPGEGTVADLGTKTLLRTDPTQKQAAEMQVELHNVDVSSLHAGDKVKMTISGAGATPDEIEIELVADDATTIDDIHVKASDITDTESLRDALVTAFNTSIKKIGGQDFTAEPVGTSDQGILFKQINEPTSNAEVVKDGLTVKIGVTANPVPSASTVTAATDKVALNWQDTTVGTSAAGVASGLTAALGTGGAVAFDGTSKVSEYINDTTWGVGTGTGAQEISVQYTGGQLGLYVGTDKIGVAVDNDGNAVTFAAITAGGTASYKFAALKTDGTTINTDVDLGTLAFNVAADGGVLANALNTATTIGQAISNTADPSDLVYVQFDEAGTAISASDLTTAIDAIGGVASGDVVMKADTANNSVALYVGNTKISDDVTYDNTAAMTFKVKGGGADILTADVSTAVNAGGAPAIGDLAATDGYKTGFTYTAAENKGNLAGTWNVSTTMNQKSQVEDAGQKASTTFTLNKDIVQDGNTLTIGKETYTFKVGKDSKTTATTGLIDLSNFKGDGTDDAKLIEEAARQLSQQSNANSAFSIGYQNDTNGKITIHEKNGQTEYVKGQLKSVEEFQKLIYANKAGKQIEGKPLTLQIGDTSESFNKIAVDIKDMHADAMGIGEIDISKQEGASKAMDAIKGAINYVSDVRGDLGATQNRLDHTINNLSVAHENIQDAESTIRDVDVAEEMMAYTKNNILVQAAQAMLAQANQLPQGVLQLLG